MARGQRHYDYPEVHPPQSQASYAANTPQTAYPHDDRFSWVQTPSEALSLRNIQNVQDVNTRSSVPPLPVIPPHLHHAAQARHEDISEESEQYQRQQQQQQPPPTWPAHHEQHQQQQQPPPPPPPESRQQLSKQQEATMYQQARSRPQTNEDTNPVAPQPPPDNHYNDGSEQADPIKQAPDHPNYRSAIVPDENPLSPTSPTHHHKPQPTRQTTNMSVLPPTPSTYAFTNYAPAPQPTTGGTWTHGLCSCSEPTICMTGLFCPCVLYGRTQHRLALRSARKDPTNMLGYDTVNGSCVAWALLCGINGVLSGIQKTRVRRSYEMEPGSGNVFGDCLVGCCCCCCVLAQNEKEVRYREEEGRGKGVAAGTGQEGYVPPDGMTFAPPPR